MRLAFWRRPPDKGPRAAPTRFDRQLLYIRVAALVGASALLLLSLGPLVADWTAPNEGADINVTTEFYTAFEHGGGFITWDFSPEASKVLRARIDAGGAGSSAGDGNVSDREFNDYAGRVSSSLRALVVLRNFQVGGVRVEEQRGIITEPVNSSTPAHVHLTFSGMWAERDADVALAKDAILEIGYNGSLTGFERVHERTILINGGLATFTGSSANSRVFRAPGASVIVSTQSYTFASSSGPAPPDVHFARFSALDSSLVLLAPVIIGYFLGVAGARREQQSTRQPRIVPLHDALFAVFLLLLAAYFAGIWGIAIWAGGCAFGVVGLLLAYRFYPAERPPPEALEPLLRRETARGAELEGRATSEEQAARALGLTVEELRAMIAEKEAARASEGAASPSQPAQSSTLVDVAPLLSKAHGPLDPADDPSKIPPAPSASISAARELLQKAVSPLALPDEDTPRPEGRSVPPRAPPPPKAAPAAPKPAAPAAPPKTRVRCPGCKHYFEAEGKRPLSVSCPHCGRHGVLR